MNEQRWVDKPAQPGSFTAKAEVDLVSSLKLTPQFDADTVRLDAALTLDSFAEWAQTSFRERIPHQRSLFGMAVRHSLGFEIQQLIPLDMPRAFLDAIRSTSGTIVCPVVSDWFRLRCLQQFDAEMPGPRDRTPWLSSFRRHGFRTQIVHGFATDDGQNVSFLSLYATKEVPSIAPLMLEAYLPAVTACLRRLSRDPFLTVRDNRLVTLTQRESEIIDWIAKGKTNWEIGQILGISELTVKSHVQRLFFKTGTNTRAQLAAHASSLRHKW